MTRASACGSSWLSVESRRVALATIATPSRADAPRRRPVAAVRHAIAAEAPATHWAGRQKARAALASATRLMSESDRASFAAYDVEFVVEISRCRAPLHRSTTEALSPAADVELYSSTALQSALHLYSSTALYTLHPLHPPSESVMTAAHPPSGLPDHGVPRRKTHAVRRLTTRPEAAVSCQITQSPRPPLRIFLLMHTAPGEARKQTRRGTPCGVESRLFVRSYLLSTRTFSIICRHRNPRAPAQD